MANASHTTNLPRRAVLAGGAAALFTAPAMAALPSAGDPVFAAKRRETVAAWAKLDALYAEQHRRLEALGPVPVIPEELLQPMRLPNKATPTAAPEEGWTARYLSEIVRTGLDLTAKTTATANGGTMRTEWKPVSAKTRKQAAELLKLREAYDAARAAWWDKAHAIEGTSVGPLGEAIDLAFDLMACPVSTLAEVKDKLALVDDWDLFNLTDDEADLRGWLIRDALAAAEKAVAHV